MSTHTSVAGFNQLLETMAQADVFTGILPFVLTYVVFFMALKQVPVLSKDDDKVPALVAIVIAFFVARFIALNPVYQQFFLGFFGKLTIGLLGFVGLLVLLAFTGFEIESGFNWPIGAMVMVVIVGAAFTTSGGLGGLLLNNQFFNTALISNAVAFTLDSGLIWLLIVGGVLAWISSDNSSGSGESPWRPFIDPSWWSDRGADRGASDETQ